MAEVNLPTSREHAFLLLGTATLSTEELAKFGRTLGERGGSCEAEKSEAIYSVMRDAI